MVLSFLISPVRFIANITAVCEMFWKELLCREDWWQELVLKRITDEVNQLHFLHFHWLNLMKWRHTKRGYINCSSRLEQVCSWKYVAHFYHGVLCQIGTWGSSPSKRRRTPLVSASQRDWFLYPAGVNYLHLHGIVSLPRTSGDLVLTFCYF